MPSAAAGIACLRIAALMGCARCLPPVKSPAGTQCFRVRPPAHSQQHVLRGPFAGTWPSCSRKCRCRGRSLWSCAANSSRRSCGKTTFSIFCDRRSSCPRSRARPRAGTLMWRNGGQIREAPAQIALSGRAYRLARSLPPSRSLLQWQTERRWAAPLQHPAGLFPGNRKQKTPSPKPSAPGPSAPARACRRLGMGRARPGPGDSDRPGESRRLARPVARIGASTARPVNACPALAPRRMRAAPAQTHEKVQPKRPD